MPSDTVIIEVAAHSGANYCSILGDGITTQGDHRLLAEIELKQLEEVTKAIDGAVADAKWLVIETATSSSVSIAILFENGFDTIEIVFDPSHGQQVLAALQAMPRLENIEALARVAA
jgi:hypothetical protein